MARPLRALTGLVILLVAACGAPTPTPAVAPSGSSPSAGVASSAGSGTSQPAASSGSAPSIDPAVVHACLGLDEPDCARALEAAAAALPAGTPVVYVEVGPFTCQAANPCDTVLAARPSGQVTFEPVTGDPIAVQVTFQADGTFGAAVREAFTVKLGPSSRPGQLGAPLPFTLGHCGLGSGIDVDGAWWDPVGFVNIDHGDAINAAQGTFVAVGPNHATFTSAGGLTVELQRRAGEKHLPLCS